MSQDLTGLKIKDTYIYVVQRRDGRFYDLLGNLIVEKAPLTIVSGSYNVSSSDEVIEVITANVTQSLPDAIDNTGKEYSIINASAGSIRIMASGSQTIGNDSASNDNYLVVFPGDAPRIISNDSNWRLI